MCARRCVTSSILLVLVLSFLLAGCQSNQGTRSDASRQGAITPAPTSSPLFFAPAPVGAFTSGRYRNLFKEMLDI